MNTAFEPHAIYATVETTRGITKRLVRQSQQVHLTIYGKPGCANCRFLENWLHRRHLQFDKTNLTLDADALHMLTQDLGWQEAPVAVVQLPNGNRLRFAGVRIDLLEHLAPVLPAADR